VTTRRDVLQIGAWGGGEWPRRRRPRPPGQRRDDSDSWRHGLHRSAPDTGSAASRLEGHAFQPRQAHCGRLAGVETLIGDRKGQLDSLRGRRWGVVVDDTGYIPNS